MGIGGVHNVSPYDIWVYRSGIENWTSLHSNLGRRGSPEWEQEHRCLAGGAMRDVAGAISDIDMATGFDEGWILNQLYGL